MAAAGDVVVAGAQPVAEADAPVRAAAQHVFTGVNRLGVVAVEKRRFAVDLGTAGVAGRRQQIHGQKGETRTVQRGVRTVDDGDVAYDAGIDLAEGRIDVQAGLHLAHPVGAGIELPGVVTPYSRVEIDCRGPAGADAGRLPGKLTGSCGVAEINVGGSNLVRWCAAVCRRRSRAHADLGKLVHVEVQQIADLAGIGCCLGWAGRRRRIGRRGKGRRVVFGQKANNSSVWPERLARGRRYIHRPTKATRNERQKNNYLACLKAHRCPPRDCSAGTVPIFVAGRHKNGTVPLAPPICIFRHKSNHRHNQAAGE